MAETDRRPVLVIEDDEGLRTQMKWALADFDCVLAGDRIEGLALFDRVQPAVVVLDLGLPPDPNGASEGLAALETILRRQRLAKVIIASGNEERAHALRAVTLGAYDFYPKPIDPQVLQLILQRAHHLYDLEAENQRLAGECPSPLAGLVAVSPQMLPVCRTVERVAGVNISVLITGESGTGKEVFARAIHQAGPRRAKPFVAINCAAIPDALLESELFGYEKGAFTGAVRQTIGIVEQAHTGTLLLDEIGDMPLALQAKLLRFLQNRTFERIGGRKEIEVDVRIISATNRDLASRMREQKFREDLFYRLNEISLPIPPLRERDGDAIVLAKFFLGKCIKEFGLSVKQFGSDALAVINAYPWPGNVRELESRVKEAALMSEGRMIGAADLKLPVEATTALMPSLWEIRKQADIAAITRALALTDNNISNAARLLEVSRPTIYELMKTANIKPKG